MGEWRELQWQQHQQCGNGCDGGNSSGGSDDDSEGGDICEENWGGNDDDIKYPQRMASTKYSLSAKYVSVLGRAITNGHSVRVRDSATLGNPRPKKISGQQLRSEPRVRLWRETLRPNQLPAGTVILAVKSENSTHLSAACRE